MNLNVLTDFPFTVRYYLIHPWKWFYHLGINIRDAWLRIIKGYCYRDVWNWDDWFCSIVPKMLRHMADYGSAYPGEKPFDTPEKWHKWLYETAHKIERLGYDNWMEDSNEYSKEYDASFENNWRPEKIEEIREKYYARGKEIHKTREQILENFGRDFFRYFDRLWD